MTATFNVILMKFDEDKIEDIVSTIIELTMLPLSSLEVHNNIPFKVFYETDARTAYRAFKTLTAIDGTDVFIFDQEARRLNIELESVSLHYGIRYRYDAGMDSWHNEKMSPMVARRELGLKTAPAPIPDAPEVTIDLSQQRRMTGADLSVIEMAKLVVEFLEDHDHAWTSGGEFIRSILSLQ